MSRQVPRPMILCGAVVASSLLSHGPATAQGQGVSREAMWPAPTAEDWAKPVKITWQRNWDDALAVAEETGKPILVCVNMDGEIASEHYAGIRYRDPEIAKLYEPYVTVIASVYRHNPRDYDEAGRRIPCPRFGCVTCGEHIAIEPVLYEKFFDGKRIAPRHIMVELEEGEAMSESYDVYYAFDTKSVFDAIERGITERTREPKPDRRTDRSLAERVASPDSRDQTAVEAAYLDGDREQKLRLLEAAAAAGDAASVDLLRLAVFDLDVELAKKARQALAQASRPEAAEVIDEALRVPLDDAERDELIAALTRIGESSTRARTLSIMHKGLVAKSREVDVDGWGQEFAGGEYEAPKEWREVEQEVEASVAKVREQPEDPAAQLELAERALRLAVDPTNASMLARDPSTQQKYARLQFEDALRAATRAEELGATGWRLDATRALAAYYLGRTGEAFERAERAMQAMPTGEPGWTAMATIALYAVARQKAIEERVRVKQDWPSEWLADVDAAYAVLGAHPLGSVQHVLDHYDFLDWLGARRRAARVLREGLDRFAASPELHARWRGRVVRDRGAAALGASYHRMVERSEDPAVVWFAGYASIVEAEFHRRAGDVGAAARAYERAVAWFDRFVEARPESRATADHYVAMAFGGRARMEFESGDLSASLEWVGKSFERAPDAAASLDGLNISTVDTAKMLRQRLVDASDRAEEAARLQTMLDALDPRMLELPAYERPPTDGGGRPR